MTTEPIQVTDNQECPYCHSNISGVATEKESKKGVKSISLMCPECDIPIPVEVNKSVGA